MALLHWPVDLASIGNFRNRSGPKLRDKPTANPPFTGGASSSLQTAPIFMKCAVMARDGCAQIVTD
jgi:hypothetical protein